MVENREVLLALAERAKAATGPDRELDHAISLHVKNKGRTGSFPTAEAWLAAANSQNWGSCRYTASLDAAMTLVPEACEWARWSPGSMVVLLPPQPDDDEKAWARTFESRGATPALALTAAALRAHAARLTQSTEDHRG